MQWCSREEALLNLFYNISSLSSSILLLYFLISNFLSKYSPFSQRNRAEYEFSEEEEEEEEEEEVEVEEEEGGSGVRLREENIVYYRQEDPRETDLVADIVEGGEGLLFYNGRCEEGEYEAELEEEGDSRGRSEDEEMDDDSKCCSNEHYSARDSFCNSRLEDGSGSDADADAEEEVSDDPQPEVPVDGYQIKKTINEVDENRVTTADNGRSYEFQRTSRREVDDIEEIYGDSGTAGSTSKSSSEWRSSITCGTDEPFSSSSRRSCPKWESYTVFQKYDEEMMFLDRISAQKLQETESLRSIQICPRSISERIILKITTMNKRPSDGRHNPYGELEATYVAQICLTWEALNWNYKNFQSKRAAEKDFDRGCPAHIAQQFQQFHVLLQRYVENEPYEQGRRPEVYARMRLLAPRLLQVPEYRDSEDEPKDEGFQSRISSVAFSMIIEDGIRTFMSFLKLDKERPCHKLASFFKRKRRRSGVDPASIVLMRKVNHRKKAKLKEVMRGRGCLLRRRKLGADESMEVVMALIDLKVASRVLRMWDITDEQLHWCEEKMGRVRISQGTLQRDSTPLFFPAH